MRRRNGMAFRQAGCSALRGRSEATARRPFVSSVSMVLAVLLLSATAARAEVTSTNPAAIVIYPKLYVVPDADTVIQLTNTAPHPVNVRCFYVDASGHCSNSPATFCDPAFPSSPACPLGGTCERGWTETDFVFRLTAKQPIVWTVSAGLPVLPLADTPGAGGQFNTGSIPPAPEVPFIGELKCIEVGDDELPVDSNDLKGEATVEFFTRTPLQADIEGYNAIGIQAIPGQNNRDNTLVLGQEYDACPDKLILDHVFDNAVVHGDVVRTILILAPCSEDFRTQLPLTSTVQFLVYNEFEQRFSTSRAITCYGAFALSDIDTRVGNGGGNDAASIFNVNVEGTITGQTVIRSVADADTTHGHGLVGIAEEFHFGEGEHSAAYVPAQRGRRTQFDIIQLPPASPAQQP